MPGWLFCPKSSKSQMVKSIQNAIWYLGVACKQYPKPLVLWKVLHAKVRYSEIFLYRTEVMQNNRQVMFRSRFISDQDSQTICKSNCWCDYNTVRGKFVLKKTVCSHFLLFGYSYPENIFSNNENNRFSGWPSRWWQHWVCVWCTWSFRISASVRVCVCTWKNGSSTSARYLSVCTDVLASHW